MTLLLKIDQYLNKIVHLCFVFLYKTFFFFFKTWIIKRKFAWNLKIRHDCVQTDLKEAFAFLQIFLLPVWQGIELNSTHLKKFLKESKKEDNSYYLRSFSYILHSVVLISFIIILMI